MIGATHATQHLTFSKICSKKRNAIIQIKIKFASNIKKDFV
jgi:hypothetical protein